MGSEVRLLTLFVGVAALSLSNLQPLSAPVVSDFHPRAGPTSGGTLIHITGGGFITTGSDRSKCNFEDTSFGSIISPQNNVVNSSYMTCILPVIDFLPPSVFASDGQHGLNLAVTARDGIRSDSMSFFVFDLSAITVDGINPNEGVNSTRTLITIYGSGFLNTDETSCSIDYDDRTLVPAVFINSTVLQCVLLTYPCTAQVTVNISVNGQPSANIATVSQTATLFTFYASPPQIITCIFSSSYASVFFNFDREVEIGGESRYNSSRSLSCNVVFSNETIVSLGINAECSWHNPQQRSSVILLTSSSVVQVDSVLTLRGDSIRTRSVEYSRLAMGNVSVSLNMQSLKPIPVLEAPDYIPNCGKLSVTAENSQHGGSRNLQYKWVIGLNFTETGNIVSDDSFKDYIPSGFTNQSSLTIPSNAFLEETVYTIQLTVRNFLNIQSLTMHSITRLNEAVPIVVILGAQVKRVRTTEETILYGTATFPDCVNATGVVDYSWSIYNQMGLEKDFCCTCTQGAVLTIPANSLFPSSVYTAVLVVSAGGQIGIGNTTVQLVTEPLDIRARISGGTERVVGVQDALVLDGTISEGLSSTITNDSLFSFTWNCSAITEIPSLCPIDPLESDANLIHIFPNATLSTGVYNFTLTLRYRDVESSAYQIVHAVPYRAPRVEITPPPQLESILVHSKLILQAQVYSDYPGSAEWRSEYVIGYAQLDLIPVLLRTPLSYQIQNTIDTTLNESSPVLFTSNVTSSPYTNQISLTLSKGVLLPGNTYRFTLTVKNSLGHVGFACMDFRTESLPLAGQLDIQPVSGDALSTEFLVKASHWTDDIGDTPLSYQFGFQYPNEETVYWSSGVIIQNQISTIFPLPSVASDSVNVILLIYDINGAVSEHQTGIDIFNSNALIDLNELMQYIEEISLHDGNWIEGNAHLTAVIVSVNRNQDLFQDIDTFRVRAVDLILQLFDSYIPQSKSFLNHLLFLLHEVTYQAELPHNTSVQVVELLESLVQTYNSLGKTSAISVPGFSEHEAQLVLETYSNLLLANGQFQGFRIRADVITDSLLRTLPVLGYGMCLQLGINEQVSVTIDDNFGSLKASQINLPVDYVTAQPCKNCTLGLSEEISIDFGSELFRQYLQWMCGAQSVCSGVCAISAQFIVNIRWQDSPYSSAVKTPVLSLALVNPMDGGILQVQNLQSSPITLSFPITAEVSNSGQLECVFWSNISNTWSNEGCSLQQITPTFESVTCECNHLSEFAVIERCPSGFFGDMCSEVCPQGLWGLECQMSCDCNNRGTCSAHDGSCDCDPGWIGSRCQEACPVGVWGKNCSEECLCENGGDCDFMTGLCNCATAPGWIGEYCNITCPDGFFGSECAGICECRVVSECVDKVSGQCTCQPGFIGSSCHEVCPGGFYGNLCTLQCSCDSQGTESCDHVNGTCYCLEQWMGELCKIEITPTPSPSPSPIPPTENGFQIWLVAVAAIAVIAIVVVAVTVVVVCWRVKHRRFKKVLPISNKKVSDLTSSLEEVETEEDELEITHAKSLTVLIPQGSKLKEMFRGQEERSGDFKEPPEMNGKIRWQIVQIFSDSLADNDERNPEILEEEVRRASKVVFELGATEENLTKQDETCGSEMESDRRDIDDREDRHVKHSPSINTGISEMLYDRGVYLGLDATLKDLRNDFIESEQLDSAEQTFQFLNSDVPGDFIPIDTEDEVMLTQIEHNLVQNRTLYIEAIDPETAQRELCICGKFADLECTECRHRGYCSEICQDNDWHRHALTCRVISAKRRRKRKKRKKNKSKRSQDYTPSLELCICGKETEFECSVCGEQGYCSESCQLKDWGYHERYCQSPGQRNTSRRSFLVPEESKGKLATVEEAAENEEQLVFDGSPEGETRWLQ